MIDFLKKYKIVIIVMSLDLLLYWVLFCSGVVLPFINQSIQEYNKTVNSAPQNIGQIIIWIFLHFPTSIIVDGITKNDSYLFISVLQTGVLSFFIEKAIRRKVSRSIKKTNPDSI